MAAGEQFEGDLGPALQQVVALLDGRGGGKGRFAQGMGNANNIDSALSTAEHIITSWE
jgi:alanyl-tRNA synthetase